MAGGTWPKRTVDRGVRQGSLGGLLERKASLTYRKHPILANLGTDWKFSLNNTSRHAHGMS